MTIPVVIDDEPAELTVADIFDVLNFASYRSHRERLTDWSVERVQLMFVKLGVGTLSDVRRWEARIELS